MVYFEAKPLVPQLKLEVPDARTVIVSPTYPSPFNSFVSAMTWLNENLNPSIENPARLQLAPGYYYEIAFSTVPIFPGTVIQGASAFATQIILLNPSADYPFLTVLGYAELLTLQITCLRISTPNNPTTLLNTVIYMENPFSALIAQNIGLTGGHKMIHCNSFGGIVVLSGAWGIFSTVLAFDPDVLDPSITGQPGWDPSQLTNPPVGDWQYLTMDIAIHMSTFGRLILSGTGSITNDIVTQGYLLFFPPNTFQSQPYQIGLLVENGAVLSTTGVSYEAGLVGVRADGASAVLCVGGSMLAMDTNFEIALSVASLYSINTVDTVTWDMVVEDPFSQVVSTGCRFDTSKLNLPTDTSNISLQYMDFSLNNERGIHNIGNLIIGDLQNPATVYFGNGSTNIQNLVVLKYDGTTYTEVTLDISPTSGLDVTMFDLLTTGVFYVGNATAFSGIRVEVSTALALGTGSVIVEYYNGTIWTQLLHMTAQFDAPHASYANALFNVIESQDIRFNNNTDIEQVAVNGTTLYWIRFRIVSPITTSPDVNSLKIYGNTSLVTGNGFTLLYGKARNRKEVPFDMSWIDSKANEAAQDQDIYLSQNLYVKRVKNSYATGEISTFGFFVPVTFDSSTPLDFHLTFYTTSGSINPFQFRLTYDCFEEGDLLYSTQGTAPPTIPTEKVINFSLTPNLTNTRSCVFADVIVPLVDCRASINGDIKQAMMFKMERIADTNPGRCVFTNIGFFQTTYILGLSENL